MSILQHRWFRISWVVLSAILYLCFYYGNIIASPNDHLFASDGDGIKNYYTYAYHVNNDSSYADFEGMNYPYGEITVFTDGHPLFANVIKLAANWFPGISNYAIGILNMCLLFSGVICIGLLYRLLREYEVSFIYSWIGAMAIFALQPQINRLTGHISLAYSFFIPLTWLLLLKYQKDKEWKWLIFISVSILILLFTHPYLGVISFFMCLLWGLFSYGIKKDFWKISGFGLLSVIIFKAILSVIDSHDNRATTPLGFIENDSVASWKTVFLSPHKPLHGFYSKFFDLSQGMPWEGWSYVGLGVILVLLVALVEGAIFLIKKRGRIKECFNKKWTVPVLLGISGLLYSFGFPYNVGLDFMADLIPEIKQIRVVGRFAWIFYYVAGVMSVVYAFKKLQLNRLAGGGLLLLCLGINLVEGHYLLQHNSSVVSKSDNSFNVDSDQYQNLQSLNFDPQTYQAILPLPYYHVGSSHNVIKNQSVIFYHSLMCSYVFNKPLLASCLSRTSISEGISLANMIAPNYFKKEISSKLDKNDQYLVVIPADQSSLNDFEKNIVNRSHFIQEKDGYGYYSINHEELFKPESDQLLNESKMFGWDNKSGVYHTDSSAFLHVNLFEEKDNHMGFFSNASYSGMKLDFNRLFEADTSSLRHDKTYDISFWSNGVEPLSTNNMGIIVETLSDGSESWSKLIDFKSSYCIIDGWHCIQTKYKPKENMVKMTLMSKAYTRENQLIQIDNVMIKEVHDTVVYYHNDVKFINNIPYLLKKD